jgi:hypothetical protein
VFIHVLRSIRYIIEICQVILLVRITLIGSELILTIVLKNNNKVCCLQMKQSLVICNFIFSKVFRKISCKLVIEPAAYK